MEAHGEEGVVEQLVRNCEHGTLWGVGEVNSVEQLLRKCGMVELNGKKEKAS